jgi:hypothetical protein
MYIWPWYAPQVILSRYLLREPGHTLSRTASLIFLKGTLCIVDRLQSIMRVPPTSDPGFQAVKREKGYLPPHHHVRQRLCRCKCSHSQNDTAFCLQNMHDRYPSFREFAACVSHPLKQRECCTVLHCLQEYKESYSTAIGPRFGNDIIAEGL